MVGLWNYNGPAIAAAIERLGKRGKIKAAVFDEDEATLAAIKNGTIDASVVQKTFQFGFLSVKWMHDLATNNEQAKKVLPASGVIHGHRQEQRRVVQGRAERYEKIAAIAPPRRQEIKQAMRQPGRSSFAIIFPRSSIFGGKSRASQNGVNDFWLRRPLYPLCTQLSGRRVGRCRRCHMSSVRSNRND